MKRKVIDILMKHALAGTKQISNYFANEDATAFCAGGLIIKEYLEEKHIEVTRANIEKYSIEVLETMFSDNDNQKGVQCPICSHVLSSVSIFAHLNNIPRNYQFSPDHNLDFLTIARKCESLITEE